MKVQELRIGNYLELLGEIRKVEGIFNLPKRKEMYWIKCEGIIDTKIIHYKPIPLTEEWLLKFVFDKDIDDFYLDINTVLFVSYNDDEFVHLKSNHLETIASIKYVHQLQNLYFALTGEELMLKQ